MFFSFVKFQLVERRRPLFTWDHPFSLTILVLAIFYHSIHCPSISVLQISLDFQTNSTLPALLRGALSPSSLQMRGPIAMSNLPYQDQYSLHTHILSFTRCNLLVALSIACLYFSVMPTLEARYPGVLGLSFDDLDSRFICNKIINNRCSK